MKLPSFLAAAAFSTVAPLFAITDADIAPAALAGKTLVFDIVNGGAPFATTGRFTGPFAASGDGFSLANVTGDTVAVTTTWSASASGGFTNCQIPGFIPGQSAATLTLYTQDGIGKYEVFISGVFGVSLNGTFTMGAPEAKAAEIAVSYRKTALRDGRSKLDFSTVPATKRGRSRTRLLTLSNTGDAPLRNLGFSVTGRYSGEFQVAAPKIGAIAPGGSITIRVTFTPESIGRHRAELHIHSNDKDENPFDIRLTGNGGGRK